MNHSTISDLEYAAVEPSRDILRLAHDKHGRVYVMTKHHTPFSAPFAVALSGVLYRDSNDGFQNYELNDIEMEWINRIGNFVSELSRVAD